MLIFAIRKRDRQQLSGGDCKHSLRFFIIPHPNQAVRFPFQPKSGQKIQPLGQICPDILNCLIKIQIVPCLPANLVHLRCRSNLLPVGVQLFVQKGLHTGQNL